MREPRARTTPPPERGPTPSTTGAPVRLSERGPNHCNVDVPAGFPAHYDRDGVLALEGDMRDVLANMEEETFTACVCDPPYGLSTVPKHIIDRIYQTFFDIGFPNLYQVVSDLVQKSRLSLISRDSTPLRWVDWPIGVEARIGVPECSVNLQNDAIPEKEIDQPHKTTSGRITNKNLSAEPDPLSSKFLGDFILNFGNTSVGPCSDPSSCRYAETFADGFAVPIVATPSTSLPSLLSSSSSIVYRDDIVGILNDSLSDSKATPFVMAFPRAVNTIMLRFDLSGRPCELRATYRAGKFNSFTHDCGPSLIRAHTTTRSLSSVAESYRVRIVVPTAHGTDLMYWLHVWVPPASTFTNVIPRGGFMGKSWDATLPDPECWREIYRVLKPGAFALIFGGTRTFHRMACAVEDAGFEVRDTLMWMYGQGFPKGYDISKGIDRLKGAKRRVTGRASHGAHNKKHETVFSDDNYEWEQHHDLTEPATSEAALWSGWNVSLKPAWEPIIVAMKPLDGTFAGNALKHGVAGLNVDGGRVGGPPPSVPQPEMRPDGHDSGHALGAGVGRSGKMSHASGRWPANIILSHDSRRVRVGTHRVKTGTTFRRNTGKGGNPLLGIPVDLTDKEDMTYADGPDGCQEVELYACVPGCPVRMLDEQAGNCPTGKLEPHHRLRASSNIAMSGANQERNPRQSFGGDSGGASRFFYTAKASTSERHSGLSKSERNLHPTVKPIDLMRYLLTLVTMPTGTLVLDPFMGSGSTLVAAKRLGIQCVGIDNDGDSCRTASARLSQRTARGLSKRKKLRRRRKR